MFLIRSLLLIFSWFQLCLFYYYDDIYNETEVPGNETTEVMLKSDDIGHPRIRRNSIAFVGIIACAFLIVAIILSIVVLMVQQRKNRAHTIKGAEDFENKNIKLFSKSLEHKSFDGIMNLNNMDLTSFTTIETSKNVSLRMNHGFVNPDYNDIKKIAFAIGSNPDEDTLFNIKISLLTNREYHIAENPFDYQSNEFWKEIFKRNISLIFSFKSPYSFLLQPQYDPNWIFDLKETDDFQFSKIEEHKYMNTSIFYTKLSIKNVKLKTKHQVKIFYIADWDINTPPQSLEYFISLYNLISTNSGRNPLLLHSTYHPDSRISLYVAFAYIVESLSKYDEEINPIGILQSAKKTGHCSIMDGNDFGFLICAIFEYFSKKEIWEESKRIRKFKNEYARDGKIFNKKVMSIGMKYRNILHYVSRLLCDQKIVSYYGVVDKFCMYDEKVLSRKCSNFYRFLHSQLLGFIKVNGAVSDDGGEESMYYRKFIRYIDVPCYDEGSVMDIDKSNFNDYVGNFVHGNKFIYETANDSFRKFIICQSPMEDSFEEFISILYKENVCVLVIMDDYDDMVDNDNKFKFVPGININEPIKDYLPLSDNEIVYGKYKVKLCGYLSIYNKRISSAEYSIEKEDSLPIVFKVIKIKSFIKSVVYESATDFVSICRMIIEYDSKKCIFIQDHSGVSNSCIVALIIHMIDMVDERYAFDPISSFINLRQSRYMALRYDYQFLFAILVIVEYFSREISSFDSSIYRGVKEKLLYNIESLINN
uniref:Tyrosine-protein phosphatase domain-containing protein n=1 Tax=Parastrongyloides trichosuri TaxID=131310 RepID=A0A0N4Z5M1_PARTI